MLSLEDLHNYNASVQQTELIDVWNNCRIITIIDALILVE